MNSHQLVALPRICYSKQNLIYINYKPIIIINPSIYINFEKNSLRPALLYLNLLFLGNAKFRRAVMK